MKLVLSTAIFLALTINGIYGGVIGDYHGGEGQEQLGHQEQIQNLEAAGSEYGGGDHGSIESNEINQEEGGGHEGLTGGGEGGDLGGHIPQWQGGFSGVGGGVDQGYANIGEGHGAGLESAGGHEDVGGGDHGLSFSSLGGGGGDHNFGFSGLGGHFEGGDEHIDLKPKVEVQHHHIPTKTIEHTEPVAVPIVKKIGVPVPHPVGVPTAQVFKIPVPQPVPVHINVPHPIPVPIYKLVPQEIEKRVPIEVQKLVPVYIEKPFKIEIEKHHIEYVDKPYPVHVPVYKHIFHHTGHKH